LQTAGNSCEVLMPVHFVAALQRSDGCSHPSDFKLEVPGLNPFDPRIDTIFNHKTKMVLSGRATDARLFTGLSAKHTMYCHCGSKPVKANRFIYPLRERKIVPRNITEMVESMYQ
jgi:hypothetical protein